jgi:2-methylcitrate dehydratase PrpD
VGATRELAAFAAEARFEHLPPDVVETVKIATLNILGCCLGGARTRVGQLHVELAKEFGGGAVSYKQQTLPTNREV